MNQPVARVLQVSADSALLRVDAAPACPRCAAGRGCGAGLLQGTMAARELRVDLPPDAQLRPGDTVRLELPPRRLLRASLVAYGLPLVAMAFGPVFANALWGPLADAWLAASALLAIAFAVVAGRRILKRDPCLSQLQPVVAARAAERQ